MPRLASEKDRRVQVHIRIDPKVDKAIRTYAKDNDVTYTSVVEDAVRFALEEETPSVTRSKKK